MSCLKLWLVVVLYILLQTGCQQHEPIPVLKPIDSINAYVKSVPDWGLSPTESIEVPQSELPAFVKLITPQSVCLQRIDRDVSYHLADIVVRHTDDTESTLMVFSTGHNPAALSFDNKTFYYGGRDDFPDGATRIVRLLREYDHEREKAKLPGTD